MKNQKDQFDTVREFIAMGVDVIVISPVVEDGWEEILKEAKDAGIPVLLSDRKINIDNDELQI